ncbi:hypothetical protein Mlute_00066 [Meiothermus luteus]|uniref:Uncharacterized protein n=1 Tax=Meiothermus luteus TaxID=2026184 RepID=A0A399F052_9DEIN|nr:hypothetical protein [Meiothermus luteus]RIH90144.1 hypothetical protein Mlute_00066 [Meiothermus luteus]
METTIHAELRARRVFVTRRGARRAKDMGELQRDLEEIARMLEKSPGEARVWLAHLDYLGEAEPPWGDFQVSETIVAAAVRWPYRGVRLRREGDRLLAQGAPREEVEPVADLLLAVLQNGENLLAAEVLACLQPKPGVEA